MTFLSSAFLVGLIAAAAPVIIHLIYRQRYPDRPFTTLRFFDKTVKHNVIQRRLIDKILLALRILAVLAIVFALARPFWNVGLGEQRQSVVIVLDNSPSMARIADNQRLFDRAKSAAGHVLDTMGPTDRAEIVLTAPRSTTHFTIDHAALRRELAQRAGQPTALMVEGEANRHLAVPEFTNDTERLSKAIDQLPAGVGASLVAYGDAHHAQLRYDLSAARAALAGAEISEASGEMRDAIASAAQALKTSNDGQRRLIVLSDLQRSEWGTETIAGLEGLDVTIGAIDPPALAGANLAIEGVRIQPAEATLGQSVVGIATVSNHGMQASEGAKLSVVAGDRGRPIEVALPPIAAGTSTLVTFPINAMTRDRELLCTATVVSSGDSFPYDDTWNFQLGVRPPVRVLLVNGVPAEAVADRETFFVGSALAPRSTTRTEVLADTRECELANLKDEQLFQYGVIVLAGAPNLDADSREKLRRFVNDGGGLFVFPGTKAEIDDYNAWGFLPARLIEQKTATFAYVKSISDYAPAIAEVRARAGGGINTLSASSWMALEATPGATILAHLSTGQPAIVEQKIGKGSVVLCAVGAHASESDWPLRPAFVVLVRSIVKELGAPQTPTAIEPVRQIGQGAATHIEEEMAKGTPALFRIVRDGNLTKYEAMPWYRQGDALVLPASQTRGQYALSAQPGMSEGALSEPGLGAVLTQFSVNQGPGESVLQPLAMTDTPALMPGARVTAKRLLDDPTVLLAESNAGRDLWRILMIAGLVFLVVESLLAWRVPSESAN